MTNTGCLGLITAGVAGALLLLLLAACGDDPYGNPQSYSIPTTTAGTTVPPTTVVTTPAETASASTTAEISTTTQPAATTSLTTTTTQPTSTTTATTAASTTAAVSTTQPTTATTAAQTTTTTQPAATTTTESAAEPGTTTTSTTEPARMISDKVRRLAELAGIAPEDAPEWFETLPEPQNIIEVAQLSIPAEVQPEWINPPVTDPLPMVVGTVYIAEETKVVNIIVELTSPGGGFPHHGVLCTIAFPPFPEAVGDRSIAALAPAGETGGTVPGYARFITDSSPRGEGRCD